MFDIGWSEMAIIMLLALIIIGPKDLPRVARTIGQWVRKGRMLAREFQTSLEEMARETELEDVKKEIEQASRMDLKKSIEKTIDPKGELSRAFDPSTETPAAAGRKTDTDTAALSHQSGKALPAQTPSPTGPGAAVDPSATVDKVARSSKAGPTDNVGLQDSGAVAKVGAANGKTASSMAEKPAKSRQAGAKSTSTSAPKTNDSSTATSARKKTVTTKSRAVKRPPAKKPVSEPPATDDQGGAEPAAVAAKSS